MASASHTALPFTTPSELNGSIFTAFPSLSPKRESGVCSKAGTLHSFLTFAPKP